MNMEFREFTGFFVAVSLAFLLSACSDGGTEKAPKTPPTAATEAAGGKSDKPRSSGDTGTSENDAYEKVKAEEELRQQAEREARIKIEAEKKVRAEIEAEDRAKEATEAADSEPADDSQAAETQAPQKTELENTVEQVEKTVQSIGDGVKAVDRLLSSE